MNIDLVELVNQVERIKLANQFEKYIDFIQFPFYRNLEFNTRINFDYPLTVFIGQNGCGKSSALHALYGTVYGKTPSQFWFDTEVDPINYYDDEKRRHSFWYKYRDNNDKEIEVVKARIRRENDPNYWETSRPLDWAGMQKGDGRSRNPPLKKHTVYLDFREELSAFDKAFYFGSSNKNSSKEKQAFIRKRSKLLKDVFTQKSAFIKAGDRRLNHKLQNLSVEELDTISFILGKRYISGKLVNHSIFEIEGYSALFQTGFASYSEAFAGSGEMAVVRLVKEILCAPEYSLILLDEPEVSLHPGAQTRLKFFLLDQIKKKKHQIVLTSHSPILIQGLPKEAIKVFQQNPSDGRFSILESLLPEEAFFHIEFITDSRKSLIVEDKLAKEIIEAVLKDMGSAKENLFYVKFYPGGESVLKKEFMTVFCRESSAKEFVIFDGDQKRAEEHIDWRTLPSNQINLRSLKKVVKEQTKEDISFSVDGNSRRGEDGQQIKLLQLYLEYYRSNVFYLPKNTPEEIIWENARADLILSLTITDKAKRAKVLQDLDEQTSFKKKFAMLSKHLSDDESSGAILQLQKLFVKAWLEQKNSDYHLIKEILEKVSRV